MKSFRIILLSILLLLFYRANSQTKALTQKLLSYSHEHPSTNLYVHLDKNFYLPGENIWFKAYLLSPFQYPSKTLYVRIVNDKERIVLTKEFLVQDIRSHGDITLPDSLPQGNYQFYAFTDNMINFNPEDVFIQPFKISLTSDRLDAEAEVSNTKTLKPGEKVEIVCHIKANGKGVKKAIGHYKLTDNKKELVKKGKVKTTSGGKAVISFIYPDIDSLEHLKLEADFMTMDSARAGVILNLPPQKKAVQLEVTPEGGHLVQGIPSRLLIHTKDQYDQPIQTRVVLKSIDDTVTSMQTDPMGLGTITFIPQIYTHYHFIIHDSVNLKNIDTFPNINTTGWGLHLKQRGGKTSAIIYNRGMPDSAHLVLRTMQQLLFDKPVSVKSGDSMIMDLPETDTTGRQVLSLALFNLQDSLYGERLFLNRRQQIYHVSFHLNKPAYGTREKIKVVMEVTDEHGKPVKGNFSVAVVAKKTLDESSYKTITQSTLTHFLKGISPDYFNHTKTEKSINNALVSSSWEHYSWPEILSYHPRGTIRMLTNGGGLTGYIKKKKKRFKLKDMKDLFLFTSSTVQPLDVKSDGSFSIDPVALLSDGSKPNYILVNEDFRRKYQLELMDYAADFDKQILVTGLLKRQVEFMTATKPPQLPPSLFAGTVRLKEVEITTTATGNGLDSATYQKLLREYPAGCLDYVCLYNYLNCPIHHSGHRPVIGGRYDYNGQGNYLYTHCLTVPKVLPNNFSVKHISRPAPFPLKDYQKNTVLTPQYLSTIFWNPNINTDENGTASFEFYSSDLKAIYKLVVQGFNIKDLEPIYGGKEFVVE